MFFSHIVNENQITLLKNETKLCELVSSGKFHGPSNLSIDYPKTRRGACANFMKVVVVVHNAPTFSRVSQREKVCSYVKLLLEMLIARCEPMPLLVWMCVYILFYSHAVKFYVHLD